ncbi:MAG: bifunctional histidinol-phosphatase/imidazoleglycerol-phosphate dehydratase HisB [Prolixibacteraceae bacterium]|jgi:imidazoleglycerol-phosphate dehydratase / histidinol-phosphatase|nr:bifunctional histidinol-phosphatase/imidazoleglycerol-phosphate dehydratase HisB [Prolixibacteraceae bacterium]MBT6762969.1 bifunctional histidinol-phosphatase/imidazoleglycerol-phosphate dehydratase HisB [Prolixibacteraceae bacterium]MBT6998246.1 bifunctional histidinol-phosphatase/imidazoleglycerol-phosphate dehydratase HisB [Prolixibacteraceae bacterium]MBT7396292.1 bifunctional histidinol-phosphatase/imidazoleglycerol-phosphate dehydratase HisB [Prolixibacteraceae bacterium]
MKKVLFIDRDGTLIYEPEDEQIDSLEKLEYLPKVFRNMYFIQKNLDYELVMVTNQDGLGTDSYPEDTFWPTHNKMLRAFENEEVTFDEVLIDRSFPKDNLPTRKPGTGMMTKYLEGDYDLANSFVIGDRLSDIQLAKNLGAKGILISNGDLVEEMEKLGLADNCALVSNDWDDIYACVALPQRTAEIARKTKETDISVKLNLDGSGVCKISSGLNFFDHMLEQIGRHAGVDLEILVKGDLEVDEHHTIEDTALALGEAFKNAVGNKLGMERYGFCLPMDDCLAMAAIDFGGRPWLVWETDFNREKVGDMPTEMFMHFFKSFSDAALCNLNIKADGKNEHHKIEAIFKALAKAIKMAIKRDVFNFELPSTKGKL